MAIRGLLLWAVIPLAVLSWVILLPMLRGRAGLARFLGWVDLNLIAALERSILRPLIRDPANWVPIGELSNVRHRIRLTDPV
jgi:hypothetical protein